jgi:osmoprotectant transport system permease protein
MKKLLLITYLLFFSSSLLAKDLRVKIGSKKFTESYVLGEIIRLQLEESLPNEYQITHKEGMGGTIILWGALKSGAIDIYPEYTGTISEVILKSKKRLSKKEIHEKLSPLGIDITEGLGFNDSYALAVTKEFAQKHKLKTISDLKALAGTKFGLSHEFIKRSDGWDQLAAFYGLPVKNIYAMEHGLSFAALESGMVDVIDVNTTDAKINKLNLVVLEDNRHFFPLYEGVVLYRKNLDRNVIDALKKLDGTIDEKKMSTMNLIAESTGSYTKAAKDYFGDMPFLENKWITNLLRLLGQHVTMVILSVLLACVFGIPLGILASRGGLFADVIIGFASVVQTIPSLALLALLVPIPFLGISYKTAILALFLYGLLPIVKNTATGIKSIPKEIIESALAMGLSESTILRKIILPLCSPQILAGIKTTTIINIGTAVLAALIGVGGLGEPIVSGLNLNDVHLILQGAIPAALLAIFVQLGFTALEKIIIPKGLQKSDENLTFS